MLQRFPMPHGCIDVQASTREADGEDLYLLFHVEGATCCGVCKREMKGIVERPSTAIFVKFALVSSATCWVAPGMQSDRPQTTPLGIHLYQIVERDERDVSLPSFISTSLCVLQTPAHPHQCLYLATLPRVLGPTAQPFG